MSGDGHTNETRELNLDAIERRAERVPGRICEVDVPALVAEVRRLREVVESLEGFPFTEQRRWTDR